ncbi:MCE family protein [Acetobacteraceae bacterium]|nr:MCE family protein [Acetobacteraceae bacterium]
MARFKRSSTSKTLFRSQYANEWTGLLVLIGFVVFIASLVEAGFVRQWLAPSGTLYFILPPNGIAGIGVGSDIDVMGAHAGEIRQLRLNESGRMYAVGNIEPQFEPFIRTDSPVMISRRFIVAGASYMDVGRGRGQPLDWGFAVLNATVAPNPQNIIMETLKDIHARAVPAMDNIEAITQNVEAITKETRLIITGIEKGKGTVGALLSKEDTLQKVNKLLDSVELSIAQLRPLEKQLNSLASNVNHSMPHVDGVLKNVDDATGQLPAVLSEAEMTADSLRKLSNQLRSLWLLGGSGQQPGITANELALPPSKASS